MRSWGNRALLNLRSRSLVSGLCGCVQVSNSVFNVACKYACTQLFPGSDSQRESVCVCGYGGKGFVFV